MIHQQNTENTIDEKTAIHFEGRERRGIAIRFKGQELQAFLRLLRKEKEGYARHETHKNQFVPKPSIEKETDR